MEATKHLLAQWPHAQPPDPKTYAASIAAVLAQYPLGVVEECCDPRRGLARHREFPPTVACLVEWLDKRLAWHVSLAKWRAAPRPWITKITHHEAAVASYALRRLWLWLKEPEETRGDPPTWKQAAADIQAEDHARSAPQREHRSTSAVSDGCQS